MARTNQAAPNALHFRQEYTRGTRQELGELHCLLLPSANQLCADCSSTLNGKHLLKERRLGGSNHQQACSGSSARRNLCLLAGISGLVWAASGSTRSAASLHTACCKPSRRWTAGLEGSTA
jgi:hypothetical protein